MIMKLGLPPEIQAGLLSQAQEKGLSPEACAAQVLRESIGVTARPIANGADLSDEEWMR